VRRCGPTRKEPSCRASLDSSSSLSVSRRGCRAAELSDVACRKEGDWTAKERPLQEAATVLPEVRLHYTTIGAADREPVMILTARASPVRRWSSAPFAGELFGRVSRSGRDEVLHRAARPRIGHGKSSKPSDGLRAKFRVRHDDMVELEYRLMTEASASRMRVSVLGNSMGGMGVWADGGEAIPPLYGHAGRWRRSRSRMSGRNWMLDA